MEIAGSVRLFGSPAVIVGDRDLAAELPAKGLALIGYLCMESGWQRREHLAGLLWGDMDEARARANLRTLLYDLKNLVPDLLEIERNAVRLEPSSAYRIDLLEARMRLDSDDPDDLWALSGILRGRFLADFLPDETPELEDWLRSAQEYWQAAAVSRLEALKDALLGAGEADRAFQVLNRILAVEPWNEPAHRELMHLHAVRGDFAAAVGQYQRLEAALDRELAVAPDGESTALYERIRRTRSPEKLRFPAQPNPFFGREIESRRLVELLRRADSRLISVLGPGGVGKTRLSLRAAEAARHLFLDGAHLVLLADWPARQPIVSPIARALGVEAPPRGDLRSALFGYLRDREALLLLDNFEHLVDQGELLAEILAEALHVKILVTSREAIGLRWEHRLNLDGLPIPQGDDPGWRGYPSAALFIDAARRVDPGFAAEQHAAAVIDVSETVEGFPLALEIAAALTAELDAWEVAARVRQNLAVVETGFRDMPERQRSLWAVFESSWQLLEPDLQDLLARLSVFRGGFDPDAAAAIAGGDPDRLDRLIRKSLLRQADGRFAFHELVRWFAGQKLANLPFALQLREAHARYFAESTRKLSADLYGDTLQASLESIRLEHANLRAAWDFCLDRAEIGQLRPMLEGLSRYYDLTSAFKDGEILFSAATAVLAEPAGRRSARGGIVADLRNAEARFLNKQGEFERAIEIVEPIAGDLAQGDETRAFANLEWGWALWRTGRYAEAQAPLEAAQRLAFRVENPLLMANSLRNLGIVAWYRSRFDEARRHTDRALAVHEEIGDLQGVADAYNNLALITGDQGDYAASLDYLQNSILIKRDIGDRNGEALGRNNLAVLYVFLGRFPEADAALEENMVLVESLDNQEMLARIHTHRSGLNDLLGRFEEARSEAQRALTLARRIGDRHVEAYVLQYVGAAHMRLGAYDEADVLFEESLAIHRKAGLPEKVFYSLSYLAINALERGDPGKAGEFVEEMISHLDAGEVNNTRILLDGLFTCYRALTASGHPDARGYLERAYRSLHEQADRIIDPDFRKSFLENVPLHVEIEEAWLAG